MTEVQYFKNLTVPAGRVDIILDTDTYNEIDDQYAISYMIRHTDKFNVMGITAAPFLNEKSVSPEDGMEKSYDEILKVLALAERTDLNNVVFKGSREYMKDEKTPVESPAANFMAELASSHSPEKPLYIVAIGAYTNIASAILKNPEMKENCVFIMLGGNATHMPSPVYEFNMMQDIAAARVIFNSGAPIIHLPASGVTDIFTTTKHELEYWLKGKNALCDYLYENTVREGESYVGPERPWTRVIWDVVPLAWFFNENEKLMEGTLIHAVVPQYNYYYSTDMRRPYIKYIYCVFRDRIFEDLFKVLGE